MSAGRLAGEYEKRQGGAEDEKYRGDEGHFVSKR